MIPLICSDKCLLHRCNVTSVFQVQIKEVFPIVSKLIKPFCGPVPSSNSQPYMYCSVCTP
uniref:Uncharacterized protein n=1 Tax=Anguilla anguilla TaxID=7936 RepID=A0A0E9U0K4_ANGAN